MKFCCCTELCMLSNTWDAVMSFLFFLLLYHLTMITPVSLLASITETRQVLGRTAAIISSTSTRAVTLDTGTHVTSVTKTHTQTHTHSYKMKIKQKLPHKVTHLSVQDCFLPARPVFCRCSATSLTESCSTLEVMM